MTPHLIPLREVTPADRQVILSGRLQAWRSAV
jgi:hypothetical protein